MKAKVIIYEFDALSRRYNRVTLGNTNPKYGDTQRQYVKQQKAETTTAPKQAIINSTQLITGNSGGYIVMHPAEKPQEIFIMDTPDISITKKSGGEIYQALATARLALTVRLRSR